MSDHRVLVAGTTLYPTYNKPFDLLAKGLESQNKRGTWDTYRTLIGV